MPRRVLHEGRPRAAAPARSTLSDSIGIHVVVVHLFACDAALVAGARAALRPKGSLPSNWGADVARVDTRLLRASSLIYTSPGPADVLSRGLGAAPNAGIGWPGDAALDEAKRAELARLAGQATALREA